MKQCVFGWSLSLPPPPMSSSSSSGLLACVQVRMGDPSSFGGHSPRKNVTFLIPNLPLSLLTATRASVAATWCRRRGRATEEKRRKVRWMPSGKKEGEKEEGREVEVEEAATGDRGRKFFFLPHAFLCFLKWKVPFCKVRSAINFNEQMSNHLGERRFSLQGFLWFPPL